MTTANESATARMKFLFFSIIRSKEKRQNAGAPTIWGSRSACSRFKLAMEHKPRDTRAAIARYGDCPIWARGLAHFMERYRPVRKPLTKI